jgi:hypothetical protein
VASVISLGLSSADLALFQRSLITGYNLKVTVQILDLNHRYITDVSSLLVDGQVNHSYFEAISYSATMTLMDPDNLVGFDTSSPSDNALYADRMIKIVYSVYSDLLPRWVDVPIFTGGVTKVTRDDAILSVECQGKEALWSAPAVTWAARTYAKNSLLTTTIRDVMARYTGETRFDFPNWTNKLSRDFSVTQETVPWDFARSLQGSRTVRHLFYDGRGVLRLRGAPTVPAFTFTEAHITSVPKLDYDHAAVKNLAYVKGAIPDGKPQIRAWRYAPGTGPAGNATLGRNGVRRQLAEIIEDDNITTQAQADAQAEQTLASISVTNVGFDFDSFPIPHLEPGDIFHLSTRDASINLRAVEFSIPLRAGTSQSNGTTRKLSANSARLRRK